MIDRRRGVPARIGVTLLNFFAPGLGLLRVGDKRRALLLFGASVGAFAVLLAALSTTTEITFAAYATLVSVGLTVELGILVASIWLTWRESTAVPEYLPVWSRWYAVVAAMLFAIGLSSAMTSISRGLYHNFYVPSEAMEPTLDKNDRFVASMRPPEELHRGDIVLVKAPSGATYVKRLAALPGDKIEVRDGLVFINGAPAPVRSRGARAVSYPYIEATQARIYLEQFPGEARPHLIQDLGRSQEDDFPEVTVAPSHVFLLGDNRDDSADSRVPAEMGGLEQVPLQNVLGRPLFFYWPRGKLGQPVQDPAR